MRPVRRGKYWKRLSKYQDAKSPLMERLGDYCSYCGRPTSYAVEHILPWKNKHARLKTSWTNFLLTCVSCNIYMSKRQDSTPYTNRAAARRRYFWPDTDNTFRAFKYLPLGAIDASPLLPPAQQTTAGATLRMLGFERGDSRARRRAEVWTAAVLSLAKWQGDPSQSRLEDIIVCAKGWGMWEVWRTVFAGEPRVVLALDQAFPGTDRRCFDKNTGQPISRPKGQL